MAGASTLSRGCLFLENISNWTCLVRQNQADVAIWCTASNWTLSTDTVEIYIVRFRDSWNISATYLWINAFSRELTLLRLLLCSPALQPYPPSIFWDPCGSRRSATKGGYPSGHQTWIPSTDSSGTCVCSMVDRCACSKRTKGEN